jgi:hypothetical protein
MAAITGAALVSLNKRDQINSDKSRAVNAVISFGDGAKTYPAGGIPLSPQTIGFRDHILNLLFVDEANSNGYVYKYDLANSKIRIYQGDYTNVAAAPLIELSGAATPAATTLKIRAEGV